MPMSAFAIGIAGSTSLADRRQGDRSFLSVREQPFFIAWYHICMNHLCQKAAMPGDMMKIVNLRLLYRITAEKLYFCDLI